jgi:hypothetical protein
VDLDVNELRRQYEAMSDEALLELDRDELVEAAQQCYDEELNLRKVRPELRKRKPSAAVTSQSIEIEWAGQEEPEWLGEAFTVLSVSTRYRNDDTTQRLRDAVDVLVNAGIPCYVRGQDREGTVVEYELMVPAKQHLQALSVLDRDMLNAEMEADWRGHFETMTDDELMELDEDMLVAGMRDRIDRLVRAYEDELLKRGLAELETESGN